MDAKKPKPEPERLKLDIGWEDAAARMLNVPAGAVPKRVVKPRKKATKKGR